MSLRTICFDANRNVVDVILISFVLKQSKKPIGGFNENGVSQVLFAIDDEDDRMTGEHLSPVERRALRVGQEGGPSDYSERDTIG